VILTAACCACLAANPTEPGPTDEALSGTVTDSEGHQYPTVKIGDQWWMAENLRTSHAADGTPLEGIWAYDNDEGNVSGYGRLYRYDAAVAAALPGWHLPTDDEWSVLEATLGDAAGAALREGGTAGFNARYGGDRHRAGFFEGIGEWGSYWSATLFSGNHGHIRNFKAGETTVNHLGDDVNAALSVRYVKG
jgi:uncharacterized protein (TIGR02145 family)